MTLFLSLLALVAWTGIGAAVFLLRADRGARISLCAVILSGPAAWWLAVQGAFDVEDETPGTN